MRTTFQHRVGDSTSIQTNRLGGIVVAGNDVIHAQRRIVGIHDADHRNTQLPGFDDGALLVTHVDHEQRCRQTFHVLDAAQAAVQLFQFALHHQRFFLGDFFIPAVGSDLFQFAQTLDGFLHGLVVGQHAAQPAMIHERRIRAHCFFLQNIASLTFGRNEQDGALLRGQLAHEILRLGEHRDGLFQIDDVNFVAMTEDERCHLGIPKTCLVPEMHTRFQHLTHSYSHDCSNRKGYCLPLASLTLLSTPTCANGKFARDDP